MKSKIKRIYYRLKTDYFMRNRYDVYEKLITDLIDNGFDFITISNYKKLSTSGKHVIIRHDIDSDVKIARKMFEIEKKHNIKTTFYFRQKTMNDKLIRDIINYGSEFGYHYEEIATFVKENKLKSKEDIEKSIPKIKKIFNENLKQIEKKYNYTIHSVAAHGDFINRKYKITNDFIFDQKSNPDVIEAYDKRIEGKLDARLSDTYGPKFWKPETPNDFLTDSSCKNVLLLVHTRYWNSAPISRIKEDMSRIIEAVKYK